ncbi:hypothetical protein BC939DRAFT_199560 [Gamsiella multidivaricata]|uniref:uncharacterized protein n=1 Tax=Gamsiella multidivaricata TaxID=101098 RepID=UPI00221E9972|nr:uncharacterized protein BC939DRAFT_199560 [Gamsiella multidivaricata]KAI7821910.1 hypothetical protein BC939DRAFT_199560 [Gamsiella multidivaricata]
MPTTVSTTVPTPAQKTTKTTATSPPSSLSSSSSSSIPVKAAIEANSLAICSLLSFLAMASPQITVAAQAVSPTWRAFHGAAIVDTSMVIFGGTTDAGRSPYGATIPGSNDVWVWSTTLRQWSQPSIQFPGSSSPAPQKFLTSIPLQSQGRMMSLVANASSPANALLALDTYFWVWSIPNSPNPAVAPQLRLGAAVGASDTHVFVHGGAAAGQNGFATTTVLNDLTKLFYFYYDADGHNFGELKMRAPFSGHQSPTDPR